MIVSSEIISYVFINTGNVSVTVHVVQRQTGLAPAPSDLHERRQKGLSMLISVETHLVVINSIKIQIEYITKEVYVCALVSLCVLKLFICRFSFFWLKLVKLLLYTVFQPSSIIWCPPWRVVSVLASTLRSLTQNTESSKPSHLGRYSHCRLFSGPLWFMSFGWFWFIVVPKHWINSLPWQAACQLFLGSSVISTALVAIV